MRRTSWEREPFSNQRQWVLSGEENNLLYSELVGAKTYSTYFYDVKLGSNGCSVTASWDYCTRCGTPPNQLASNCCYELERSSRALLLQGPSFLICGPV